MKRFRPYCGGYILLYALTLLSLVDTGYTIYRQVRGVNDTVSSFSFFAYIITLMAFCYVWMYARSQVAIDEKSLRIANPANIAAKQGEPRAMILFRQGGSDIRFIDKTLKLDAITAYGYVEDLGYRQIDTSQAGEKNVLFPIHEVAFITSENKRYHMNAAIYSKKQRREMFSLIRDRTGVAPTGRLLQEIEGQGN